MFYRRVSSRVRVVVLIMGVVAGSLLLTAVPQGQQQVQGRGRAVPVQAPQVPTVSVPQIKTPTVIVPDATRIAQTPQQVSGPTFDSAHLRAWVQAQREGLNYIPGEVLVKFRSGVGTDGQSRALRALASQPSADSLEWTGGVAVVRDATQANAFILADQLKSQPEVEYAEPNFIVHIGPVDAVDTPPASALVKPVARPNRGSTASVAAFTPTEPAFASLQWNFQLINMPGAWDIQPGGSSDIIVAVIDTGVTTGSGFLTYPIWTGSTFQTTSMPYGPNTDLPTTRQTLPRDFSGAIVPGLPLVDTSSHGSHVSATIGEATNNALLATGMAYNVRIMPLKVCLSYWDFAMLQGALGIDGFPAGFDFPTDASCSYNDMANAIIYAVDNGARVMNISIGGGAPSSQTLLNALIYASNKGAFISISMGNDFLKGNPTSYPAFYAASIDGVMSVASVGPTSAKASYSSTGSHCEIAAPGGDLTPTRADSGMIWQSAPVTSDHMLFRSTARFDVYNVQGFSGTSMAAPHVAGLAALLMSQMPRLTGAQAEKIIRMTAKDLGTKGRDDSFGYGLIQPKVALFGYGISR